MTDSDKPAFVQAFTRLATALREPPADAAILRVYFDGLTVFEVELVVAAAERLMTESTWFPKLSEWRAMAGKIEAERVEAQRAVLRNLPAPLCAICDDTGWAPVGVGLTVGSKVRAGAVAAERVEPCACRHRRRSELLGRRPLPPPPESMPEGDGGATLAKVETMVARLAATKGMRPIDRPVACDADVADEE